MNDTVSRRPDRLWLYFGAANDLVTGGYTGLVPFLDALERAGDFAPTQVHGRRKRKYSRAAVYKSLEETYRSSGRFPAADLYLEHPLWGRHCISAYIAANPTPTYDNFHFSMPSLSLPELLSPEHAEARCRSLVELVRACARHYTALHAIGHSSADLDRAGHPAYGRRKDTYESNPHDRVYAVYWLNIFSRQLVDSIGRERVLSTPAHLVEEYPSGAVLVLTRPTLADFASEEGRVAQARALAHLRPDLDFDTVLRELRARSAALAPVEPRFDPDIAELLHRTLEHDVPLGDYQLRVAELNAYRPPPVDEWLPLEAALPSDVPNSKAALENYAFRSEQLVALLHTDYPSVFDETPEALTDIDYEFWVGRYPESYERHKIENIVIPCAGAFLGGALVSQLGGRWVPRRNLDEAQVIVGNRAWLPFARARRCLTSTQSVIDYSLTKLFREAERHHRAQSVTH